VHSLLDCPEALAGVRRTLDFCKQIVQNEMNSATDNPLVYFKEDGFEEDTLVSAGNFHGEYVAKTADFIGNALFTLGKFSEARI
jgi:histidine ammonia-lyase